MLGSSEHFLRLGDQCIRRDWLDQKIHGALPRYDPAETRQWLDAMDREIRSYAERMRTMVNAAIDESTFDDLLGHLRSRRFAIQRAGPLTASGQSKPVAWVLVASRETANAD